MAEFNHWFKLRRQNALVLSMGQFSSSELSTQSIVPSQTYLNSIDYVDICIKNCKNITQDLGIQKPRVLHLN